MKKILFGITILLLTMSVGYGESIEQIKEELNADQPLSIGDQVYKKSVILTIFPPGDGPSSDMTVKSLTYVYLGLENNNIKMRQEYFEHKKSPNTKTDILLLPLDVNKQTSFDAPILNTDGLIYKDESRVLSIKIVDDQNNIKAELLEEKTANPTIQPLQQLEQSSPLTLTIKSDKSVYAVGEKIEIGVTLENISPKEFYLNTWIFYHPQMLEASVTGPDGVVAKTINIKYNMKMPEKSDYVLLNPDGFYKSKVFSESSPYHFLGYEFLKPGVYTITMVYSNNRDTYFIPGQKGGVNKVLNVWFGTLTSNTITIEVIEKKTQLHSGGPGNGVSKEKALKLVQEYIRENDISVLDINKPLSIKEYSRVKEHDSWLIHYEYKREYQSDPPPWHVFIVDKETGEIRKVDLL